MEGSARVVKRRKNWGRRGERKRGLWGGDKYSTAQLLTRSYYPDTPSLPPLSPVRLLRARKQMECESSGRRLQSGFIQLAGLSK